MKTKALLFIITCFALLTLFSGCKKDKDKPTITMKTESNNVTIYMAGNGTINIDWGDGSEIEIFTLSAVDEYGNWPDKNYSHNYTVASVHTITITEEKLTHLQCNNNQLITLDVSGCSTLTNLFCSDNQLTNLNVSNCIALTSLYCYNNQLIDLNVSNCKLLTYFDCSKNQINNLDINNYKAITYLQCSINEITNLDVKNCIALTGLYCNNNQLMSLDVSDCIDLIWLGCGANRLTSTELNVLFGTLRGNPIEQNKTIYIDDNPGTDDCDRTIATNKGWRFFDN